MAESSRSRVTITLGRSGQVVKRPGLIKNESSVSYSQPSVGNKRSIQARLGSYADPDMPLNNKRQVRDGSRSSLSVSDDSDDVTLTKDDLRFKIMRKGSSQSSIQQKSVDLRDLLSRPAHSTTRTREQMPVLRNTKDQIPEPRHVRPPMPMPMPKNTDRQLLSESGDNRQKLPAPRMNEYENTRYHPGPGPNGSGSFSQVRPSSSTKTMPDLDSLRRAYSPWTLDSLRKRSPDRLPSTSRGLSPPRRIEESDRRPPSRSYDDSRASSVLSKYAVDHPNSMYPSAYAAKALQTVVASKMMLPPPVTQLPSSAAPVQRNPYAVDQYSVDAFLHSLGLDKYSINFKAEEVDMFALRRMGDSDLKDLGIPMVWCHRYRFILTNIREVLLREVPIRDLPAWQNLDHTVLFQGPRKKILLTLLSQAKRQL